MDILIPHQIYLRAANKAFERADKWRVYLRALALKRHERLPCFITRRHDESTDDEPETARQRFERRLKEQPNFFDGEAFLADDFFDEVFFAERLERNECKIC
jgi:hypothetical protein